VYITLRGTPGGSKTVEPGQRAARRSRIPAAVLGLGTVSLLTDISSESVAAVLPLYITVVVGMGPLAFGFIDALYQGMSALVRIAGGWWADRTDRPKWIALAGYGLAAVARLALLFSQGFWIITSTIAADRVGKGLRTGPRDSLIATASEPEFLGRNFGVHRAMDTTGALIGPLIAFAVLAAFPLGLGGYHTIFVFSSAFAVMGVAVLVLGVPDLRRSSNAVADVVAPPVRPRLADLKSAGLSRLLVAAGALGVATVGDGFLYLALQDGNQITPSLFPLLFVGTNAAYLALAIPLGRLADRVGRAKVFLVGHVVLLATYALAASHFGGAVGTIVVLLLLGTFYAATDGVLAAIASRQVPERMRASGISAAQTVQAIARFASSIGFGLMWQFGGRSTAILVMAALLVVAIGVACWVLVIRPAADMPQASPSSTGKAS
jgi:MFS family permease